MSDATSECFEKIRQEHRELEREVGQLRNLLATPPQAIERPALFDVVDRLCTTLGRHFRYEEQGGYLAQVVSRFPNWSAEVEHLRQQHGELRHEIGEARGLLEEETDWAQQALEIHRRLNDWVAKLASHQDRENRLYQEAFNLDVGQGE
jgi:hemerythrin